ncbi:hypothetical protein Tco_0141710, partial [Tanacetum coccineum]
MFDESLNPPPYVDLQAPEVIAPIHEIVAPKHAVKLDELGGILKNKARLVARGYLQEEGIDFEESFALVARWYDMLSSFLISNDFSKGSVDPTLFICRE